MLPDGPILIYGFAAEGRSTLAWLKANRPGTTVHVADDKPVDLQGEAEPIAPADVIPAIKAGRFAAIVKTPGISLYRPEFDAAREAGIPVTSNLNIWAQYARGGTQTIAITGTKGKSTAATLVHAMLQASGIDAMLAGNVGTPFLDLPRGHDWAVLELSSYQCADINFAPDIAAVLNLSPEHVDWHGSVGRYYRDKLNLIDRDGDFLLCLGDVGATTLPDRALAKPRISALEVPTAEAIRTALAGSSLLGAHNRDNALFAARLALAAGANLDGIVTAIAGFRPLAHRLEPHALGDHLFVDDSISTTPVSTLAALETYDGRRIALIVGGHDREQDYTTLAHRIRLGSVALVATLPANGPRIADLIGEVAPDTSLLDAADLTEAMSWLHTHRDRFEVALLSPGAPSYGQPLRPGTVFTNYKERGDAFIKLAGDLFGNR